MPGTDQAVARVAATQFGLLTRQQALDAGFSRAAIQRRLSHGRWLRIEHGVYVVHGAPISWNVKVLAACLSTGGIASHRTAAVLHGVAGFRPGRPEITIPRRTRGMSVQARVHQSRDLHLTTPTWRDGIPVTDTARLAVDLGSVVPFERYELAMDDMIGAKLLTWDQALDSVIRHGKRGRNGVGSLRALLRERYGDEVSESALERAFERMLRHTGLAAPMPQYNISDELGFIARVDFAYPEQRIAIELDSKKHHLHARAFEDDPRKRNRLKLAGWLVLEYTWDMVINRPTMVLHQIRQALESR